MARGKPLAISQIRDSLYYALMGVERAEIAGYLGLHEDTIKRMRTRHDYQQLSQYLAEHIKNLSVSELHAIIEDS